MHPGGVHISCTRDVNPRDAPWGVHISCTREVNPRDAPWAVHIARTREVNPRDAPRASLGEIRPRGAVGRASYRISTSKVPLERQPTGPVPVKRPSIFRLEVALPLKR